MKQQQILTEESRMALTAYRLQRAKETKFIHAIEIELT
jgi:hypothetical protein